MSGDTSIRAAILGCGSIARTHVDALATVDGVEICAVADLDERRRAVIAAAAGGVAAYASADDLMRKERPDAVHVLTPPSSHAALTLSSIRSGAHVLVEKPMALSTAEADAMIEAASAAGRVVATCHNMLFKPSMRRAIELVRNGEIGRVVHVVTFWGVAGETGPYAGDPGAHWAWRLPGGFFTNFLPHTISLQEQFLGPDLEVGDVVVGATEGDVVAPTDLSVTFRGASGWGTMTVSTSIRPGMKFVEIYGTQGVIRVDMARETCVVQRQRRAPGVVAKVLFGIEHAAQLIVGTTVSAAMVATGGWGNNPGMAPLVQEFYDSIRAGVAPTVDAVRGRSMVAAMEEIWAKAGSHLEVRTEAGAAPAPVSREKRVDLPELAGRRVLVTGATGFLGGNLARRLREAGADVAVLVRSRKRLAFDIEAFAEFFEGDLGDEAAVEKAVAGSTYVFHCAAVTTNKATWEQHYEDTVVATRNLCDAAVSAGVKRLVHISSVAVYGFDDAYDGRVIDEATPLATDVDPWSPYTRAKIEAEGTARGFGDRLAVTVLRPGILYGPGRPLKAGLVRMGNWWLSIGSGRNAMPYTYVGNLVEAMLLAATDAAAAGETFNIVDEPQAGIVEMLSEEHTGNPCHIIAFPPRLARGLAALDERRVARRGGGAAPKLSRSAVRGRVRDIRYDTQKARSMLGWVGTPSYEAAVGDTDRSIRIFEGDA